ncbi:Aprataxin [Manis pentadactyla]|nr:Aprataxin [Manis pentadactyla]
MTAADVGGFRGLGPQRNGMSLPWLLEPSQRTFADTQASGAEVSQSGGTEPGWTTCLANRKTINTCNSAMWIAMQASSPVVLTWGRLCVRLGTRTLAHRP